MTIPLPGVESIVIFSSVAGATILAMLLSLFLLRTIRKHRTAVRCELSVANLEPPRPVRHTVILPVPALPNRAVLATVGYAKSMSKDIIAVHVNIEGRDPAEIQSAWRKFVDDVPLIVLESPHRSVLRPLLRFIDEMAALREEDKLTVVMSELVPDRWWHKLLHNQMGFLLKEELLCRPGIVVTSVRYHMKSAPQTETEF